MHYTRAFSHHFFRMRSFIVIAHHCMCLTKRLALDMFHQILQQNGEGVTRAPRAASADWAGGEMRLHSRRQCYACQAAQKISGHCSRMYIATDAPSQPEPRRQGRSELRACVCVFRPLQAAVQTCIRRLEGSHVGQQAKSL